MRRELALPLFFMLVLVAIVLYYNRARNELIAAQQAQYMRVAEANAQDRELPDSFLGEWQQQAQEAQASGNGLLKQFGEQLRHTFQNIVNRRK